MTERDNQQLDAENDLTDASYQEVHEVKRTTPAPHRYVEHTETRVTAYTPRPINDPIQRRYTLVRITEIIWLITGFLESLIGIRFVLKLIAANPNAGFAQFIYGMTGPFLVPFHDLTAAPAVAGAVLEIPSLIAMLVYALLAWGIVLILWIVFDSPRRPPTI
jgi:YggT family protein